MSRKKEREKVLDVLHAPKCNKYIWQFFPLLSLKFEKKAFSIVLLPKIVKPIRKETRKLWDQALQKTESSFPLNFPLEGGKYILWYKKIVIRLLYCSNGTRSLECFYLTSSSLSSCFNAFESKLVY